MLVSVLVVVMICYSISISQVQTLTVVRCIMLRILFTCLHIHVGAEGLQSAGGHCW